MTPCLPCLINVFINLFKVQVEVATLGNGNRKPGAVWRVPSADRLIFPVVFPVSMAAQVARMFDVGAHDISFQLLWIGADAPPLTEQPLDQPAQIRSAYFASLPLTTVLNSAR